MRSKPFIHSIFIPCSSSGESIKHSFFSDGNRRGSFHWVEQHGFRLSQSSVAEQKLNV
ncbi:hypothetical protein A1Q_2879 [Vibrio campbellii HY01]|nr:hypothetical protein A1Q_2879 [Vibrio campbellii HY01]